MAKTSVVYSKDEISRVEKHAVQKFIVEAKTGLVEHSKKVFRSNAVIERVPENILLRILKALRRGTTQIVLLPFVWVAQYSVRFTDILEKSEPGEQSA